MGKFLSTISTNEMTEFCTRWKIRELALFGSALRDDFRSDSDLDILVSFTPNAEWGLLGHVQMQLELERVFGRSVDLISKRALEHSSNWIRRREILQSAKILYSEEAAHVSR